MSIQFRCPTCAKLLKAPENTVGQTVKCPNCLAHVQVPEPVYDAEEAPAPSFDPGPALSEAPFPSYETAAAPEEAPADQDQRQPCPVCGEMIKVGAVKCRYCGEVFDATLRRAERGGRGGRRRSGSNAGMTCSILSIVFACVSLIVCPPIFGLTGLVLGIIGTVQAERKTTGIIGIVLSVICMTLGMIIGVLMLNQGRFR